MDNDKNDSQLNIEKIKIPFQKIPKIILQYIVRFLAERITKFCKVLITKSADAVSIAKLSK